MPRRRKNKQRARRRNNNKQNQRSNFSSGNSRVPRNLKGNYPFPESQIVHLQTRLTFGMAGAAAFVVNDFRLNSLWTFDVTRGTTNDFSGVTQLAAIYDSYHVEAATIQFSLSGNETGQPVFFGLTFKDDQPSVSITTLAHAQNALEVAPTTGTIVVGQTSGMEIFRSRRYNIRCGSIVGNRLSYMSDLSYTAAFGSNPDQSVWMGAIAYGVGGNITNGVLVLLSVNLRVRVYSIKVLQE